MRIVMITYRGLPRGGVVHASRLAEALARLGHEVKLYFIWHMARDGEDGRTFYRKLDIDVTSVAYDGPDEKVTRTAVEEMSSRLSLELPEGYDIYHVHDAIGAAAVRALPGRGGKLVWTIHHLDTYNDPRLDEFFLQQLPLADAYATVSDFWHRRLQEIHGLDSMIVHNGVDTERYLPGLDTGYWREKLDTGDGPVLLFVGGLEPRKGIEHMLLTMELVSRKIPSARLVVVGKGAVSSVSGEKEMVKALMARTGTTSRVSFLENVDEDEMPALFNLADMVVLPSRNEGWGLSLHEGMACAKPVAAFSVGGVGELVSDEVGILRPFGDIHGLAEGIVGLLNDAPTASRMGNMGRQRARIYNWGRSAAEAIRVYRRVRGMDA